MKKDYSDSIAAQMQATLASPEHLALFTLADHKCSKCKCEPCECDSHSAKDSKDSKDDCMADDNNDQQTPSKDPALQKLVDESKRVGGPSVTPSAPPPVKPPSRVEYRDANDDKDIPAGGSKGSGAPGDPMKFEPDPKLDVVKAKPQGQKADDHDHNDKALYNDKAHADDGSKHSDSSMADDDAALAFDTAIVNLLSASSALDAAGLVKSATLSLELAQFVVEAKKKAKDKKKKKMESGKSEKKDSKKDSKKSDSKKSDSKKDTKSSKK